MSVFLLVPLASVPVHDREKRLVHAAVERMNHAAPVLVDLLRDSVCFVTD
jgi:hypothetical protein